MKLTSKIFYSVIFSLFILQTTQAQKFFLELEEALNSPYSAVQCIHYYPVDIGEGKHHYVEVSRIRINGNNIEIIETWENWSGATARTVLRGTFQGDKITGTWKSDYSGGTWNYDLKTNEGKWNKTTSMFGSMSDKFKTFKTMYPLKFKVVSNKELKDGFY